MLGRIFPMLHSAAAFAALQIAGAAAVFVFASALHRYLLSSLNRRLEAPLRRKLLETANTVTGAAERQPLFVGMSPGSAARMFGATQDWTMGFLILEPRQLSFVGEKIEFRIPRAQIQSIDDAAPWPAWPSTRRTIIRWNPGSDEPGLLRSVTFIGIDSGARAATAAGAAKLRPRSRNG